MPETVKLDASEVKAMAFDLGASLCGIASADAFDGAPKGFSPRDVLPGCTSVIVLARPFLRSSLMAATTIPYTDIRNYLTRKIDESSIELAYRLEARGAVTVPINAIGPCEYDTATGRTRGIISLKHAAELAGLGRIGKNTLLITKEYGNMVWLGAVLTRTLLDTDPGTQVPACPPTCRLCLDACPIGALESTLMNQKACWNYAFGEKDGGEWRIKCHRCRSVCPRNNEK
jgi:epoxyqueuosine reductase QueG